MAKRLSDGTIGELSLIFKNFKGSEWAPRNDEALVLGTKGAPVEKTDSPFQLPSWLNVVVDMAKKAGGFPVSSDVPDDIDNDDDGADDYNQIVGCVCSLYYDLSSAMGICDDQSRSFAIKIAIDNFLKSLDDLRSGEDDDAMKAGKRHSAADQAKIDAASDAHDKMGKAIEAMQKAHAAMGENLDGLKPQAADSKDGAYGDDAEKAQAVKALEAFSPGEVGEDGYPVNYSEYVELCQKAKKDDKKPYGDVEYADPKNGKYPIDTKEHAKAAWSYINMPKNAKFYSAEELAEVKARIKAACKKFGVEISDESDKAGASATDSNMESDMNADEVKAMIAEALAAKEAEAAKAAEAAQAEIDAAKAAAEKAQADAEQAAKDAEAAKAAQKAAEDALNAAARKPTGKGEFKGEKAGESGLVRALKAANAGTPITMQGRDAA